MLDIDSRSEPAWRQRCWWTGGPSGTRRAPRVMCRQQKPRRGAVS